MAILVGCTCLLRVNKSTGIIKYRESVDSNNVGAKNEGHTTGKVNHEEKTSRIGLFEII